MEKKDIPQDSMIFDGQLAACYAVEGNGRYVIGKSAGWDAVNVANAQAWEFISQQIAKVVDEILAGKKSVLAFHMERFQMDVALLAKYVNLPKWRVRRHLNPAVFNHLKPEMLKRYAKVFQLTVDAFLILPEPGNLLFFQHRKE